MLVVWYGLLGSAYRTLGGLYYGQKRLSTAPTTAADVAYTQLHGALDVMQSKFYSPWLGTWPESIDWTGAVLNTHLSAVVGSISPVKDKESLLCLSENELNKYFDHSIGYYFVENHFAIRNEAYDDMLWVVLGWLESMQLIDSRSQYYITQSILGWHGEQFMPAFAHRARVFYELAEDGWDEKLCGGGLTWNPRLLPYKNAITNQLFIAASAAMYLHFPGDENESPFQSAGAPTYDARYLRNAVKGYEWLRRSGMTNNQGLYVDGFHIKDYQTNRSKTECDDRNEMVYTYNQGVILSGLRGLWEGTGNTTYLDDGHELIRNVIRATGWPETGASSAGFAHERWSGLGSRGILTELCDPFGTCTQDSQTFKGIFFHHITAFCKSLPREAKAPGKTRGASKQIAAAHRASCDGYLPWVEHNAHAALNTRDASGVFGSWWGLGLSEDKSGARTRGSRVNPLSAIPDGAIDYRNDPSTIDSDAENVSTASRAMPKSPVTPSGGLNDRGRGRTVETQSGGLAVTRALWEFLRSSNECSDDI
ncbi:glycoside hydrolase family 76 protein [Sporormia fimetaria CBS 119925]|uniref:Glycoside hydrolase family 76 protein n=1 Tax=Sporormia fimetaria CBS 119925 TaxID=1340428 RepID=A0A6A6UZZ8_9PLEO|nr:glycoside hydrolase family 76 protein [Sporormia fimetaria CBS 119925]